MEPIRVLAVDDSGDFVCLTADMLEREDDAFTVETATNAVNALARVRSSRSNGDGSTYDCVVSDYDMPGMNGLELLGELRAEGDTTPFIMLTGKGSEAVAAEAIANGVTDYLVKQGGTDQYAVLAHRIKSAVEHARAVAELTRTNRFHEKLLTHATDMIAVVSPNHDIVFASGAVERVLGYTPAELAEIGPFGLIHEDHRERIEEQFERRLSEPGAEHPPYVYLAAVNKSGETVGCRARAYDFTDDPDIGGMVLYARLETPDGEEDTRVPPPSRVVHTTSSTPSYSTFETPP